MTVTITTQGNPVNIASDHQTVTVNMTNYDTSSVALVAAASASASAAQAALYDGPRLNDVPSLLADTVLSYVSGAGKTVVAVGSYVLTRKEGFIYQVAASGASDQHVMTSGGVKLYVKPSQDGYYITAFGAAGDGITDDTNAVRKWATAGATDGFSSVLTFGTYVTQTITLSSNATIIGEGTLRKKAATTGNLIFSSANLVVSGNIILDPNAANCPNGSATATSDCGISHTGSRLSVRNIRILDAVSSCIRSSATDFLEVIDCVCTGGWFALYGTVGTTCRVSIRGGDFGNSTKDDVIQILNALNISISGVTAHDGYRSGIVVNSAVANARIIGNYCYNNKIDPANQGGWGIICSVSTKNSVISNNVCRNNQRGPLTVDTYTTGLPDNTTDSWTIVSNNVCDGDYGGSRATSGIVINGAKGCRVTGNHIRRVNQGILAVDAARLTVSGNSFEDVGTYFVQFLRCTSARFSENSMMTCAYASGAVMNFYECSDLYVGANSLNDLSGAGQHLIRLSDCSDFVVERQVAEKVGAGSGYIIYMTGTLSRGRILGNTVRSSLAAYQWYIAASSTTVTDIVAAGNEIAVSGITLSPQRLVLGQTAIVLDGETINGVKDRFAAAPTSWSFRDGYTAVNNNIFQFWNGTAWVTV